MQSIFALRNRIQSYLLDFQRMGLNRCPMLLAFSKSIKYHFLPNMKSITMQKAVFGKEITVRALFRLHRES